MADTHTAALAANTGSHDVAAPFYDRLLRPYAPLAVFAGEGSQGSWTLTACDTNPAANAGTYLRSRLTLTPAPATATSGR